MTARKEAKKLASEIRSALKSKGLSQSRLSVMAAVEPSQVSRIVGGKFVRFSENAMRICKTLGVGPFDPRGVEIDPIAQQLQAEILKAWDGTSEGARHLTRLMREVTALRDQQWKSTK